jgi:hypothetical protein
VCVNDHGHLLLTNHGSALLAALSVSHPVGRALLEEVRAHGDRYGDSSLALLLAAEAGLRQAAAEVDRTGGGGGGGTVPLAARQHELSRCLLALLEGPLSRVLDAAIARGETRIPLGGVDASTSAAPRGPHTDPLPDLSPRAALSALLHTLLRPKLDPSIANTLCSTLVDLFLWEINRPMLSPYPSPPRTTVSSLTALDDMCRAPPVVLVPGASVSSSLLLEGIVLSQPLASPYMLPILRKRQQAAASGGGGGSAGAHRPAPSTLHPLASFVIITGPIDPLPSDPTPPSSSSLQQPSLDLLAITEGRQQGHTDGVPDPVQWRLRHVREALAVLAKRGCLAVLCTETIPPDLGKELFADHLF